MPATPADSVDRLCGTFFPIYAKWEQLMLSQTLLWEQTKGRSATAIIEQDLRHIGLFFSAADAQGGRAEIALLSECIAHVRLRESQLPKQAMLEPEIDKAYRELSLAISQIEQGIALPAASYDAPVSWQISGLLADKGKTSPSTHNALTECFIEIGSLFILRDGNVTAKEDSKLKVYHAAFGR